jgi:hypothetical protein
MANPKHDARSNDAASYARVDIKLQAVVIPVSNVDRAKQFYGNLGWRLDGERPSNTARGVVSSYRSIKPERQLPPGIPQRQT